VSFGGHSALGFLLDAEDLHAGWRMSFSLARLPKAVGNDAEAYRHFLENAVAREGPSIETEEDQNT
jgi:hypothetical protein